jgi:gluconolactonase
MEWEVLASGYGLAEAPVVDTDGSLLFSDVLGGGVYRVDEQGNVATVIPKRRGVGGIALHADGGIVCSGRDVIHVADGVTRTVLSVDGVAGWNDIGTDAAGRVFAGALRFAVFDPQAEVEPGEVWCVDPDIGPWTVFRDVVHANGIAISPDQLTVYVSDTRARKLITYDLTTEVRTEIAVQAYGSPDGMAVDEAGAIWLALVDGGLARFRPDGTLDRRVEVPSGFVTSVCFDGSTMYVTTGDNTDDPARKGCVLRGAADVAGAPVAPARV